MTTAHLKPGQPIYTINDLRRRFGDREVLRGLTFSLYPGDRVEVMGINGSGKSTLMKILAGEDKELRGDLRSLARSHRRDRRARAPARPEQDGPREH